MTLFDILRAVHAGIGTTLHLLDPLPGPSATAPAPEAGADTGHRPTLTALTVLTARDQVHVHIERSPAGIQGVLCGPWGALTGEPDQLESLADVAALLATTVRARRENPGAAE